MGGIIHRDLTPKNVLIHKGVLKITDFGISKQIKETIEVQTFTNSWNVDYQSPERLMKRGYDTKSDIWQLGCLLYYLTALKHPFADAVTPLEKQDNILQSNYEGIPDHYSDELSEMISDCLSVDPEDRPDAV